MDTLNPVATIVGAVVGGVVVVGLTRYFRKRSLEYWIQVREVLHPPESLFIQYRNGKVERLGILTFGMRNTGRRAITTADFAVPVLVSFERRQSRLIDATASGDAAHKTEVAGTDGGFEVRPSLINPGEQLQVDCLVDGSADAEAIIRLTEGRVSKGSRYPAPPTRHLTAIVLLGILVLGFAGTSQFVDWLKQRVVPNAVTVLGVGSFLFLVIGGIVLFGLIYEGRSQ